MIKSISYKLILLLVVAALLPLTLFGILAIWTSRDAAMEAVERAHRAVAQRAAEQIADYIDERTAVLQALAQHLGQTDLQQWQQERIIKNYVIQFDEFRQITLTDGGGREIATSRLGVELGAHPDDPAFQAAGRGEVYRSAVFMSDNLTPAMVIAVPVKALGQVQGALIGEVNLIAMWRLVDSIRIGQEGYAFVASDQGKLLAHGRGAAKPRVLQEEDLSALPVVQAAMRGESGAVTYRNADPEGPEVEYIGVSAPVRGLGWALVIEQTTHEAYAQAGRMTRQLLALVGLFVLLMGFVGYLGGRRYLVEPIQRLMQATKRVAGGDLAGTVKISTGDEFQALGDAFNDMAGKLTALQEQIRRDERAVTFGKIAAGLVHDLRHPILNIENSSRLLMKRYDDAGQREQFFRIVTRELADINRFFNDLRDLTRPLPLTIITLDLRAALLELTEAFQEELTKQGVRLILDAGESPLYVHADKFAIGRVMKNLVRNALEAMPAGGTLTITASVAGQPEQRSHGQEVVSLSFADTGCGIPPDRLEGLFTDYVTTKRRGLGLGLAMVRKIVEELGGTISVSSREKEGTCMTVHLKCAEHSSA